jgi:two-component system sensor histidine kinase AtoS
MTAYGKKDLIIDALRNRCDSFIEKPFTLDQLIREVDRAEMYILENMSLHQISESIPKFLHQINNPITCIYGSAEIALNRLNDTETIKKCIQRIIDSVESIVRINGEILKNAHPDEAIREAVEIKSLIYDCLAMFEDVMTLKGVSVCNSLSGPPLYVMGHRFDLEQIFRNLIVNAIDAMDGKAQKILSFQADTKENYCSISIVDTGCGIPDDAIDMIFTPYFTLKKNGTGLGLAVVKKVVEEHRGKIMVTSLEGKTTTFMVILPLVDPVQTGDLM